MYQKNFLPLVSRFGSLAGNRYGCWALYIYQNIRLSRRKIFYLDSVSLFLWKIDRWWTNVVFFQSVSFQTKETSDLKRKDRFQIEAEERHIVELKHEKNGWNPQESRHCFSSFLWQAFYHPVLEISSFLYMFYGESITAIQMNRPFVCTLYCVSETEALVFFSSVWLNDCRLHQSVCQ